MTIRPVRTKEDYEAACKRVDEIFQAEPGSREEAELDVLVTLVDAYEEKHFKVGLPHPIDSIEIQMRNLGISRKELGEWLGKSTGRVFDLLNCRRHLTLEAIRVLSERLHIPIEVLSQDYPIHGATRKAFGSKAHCSGTLP
jgi:HTH-type transcriptional regulator / antitoxin HigA